MKRTLLLICTLLCANVLWAQNEDPNAIPADFTVDGVGYIIKSTNEVWVHNRVDNDLSANLTIPTSVTNNSVVYNVTSIEYNAFVNCNVLTSVVIPNSVTSIGDNAFMGCGSLSSVTIGENVTSIGSSAFKVCLSLTSISIPNSVTTIGNNIFEACGRLETVTIGSGLTAISNHAFSECVLLETVTFNGSNLTSIGSWAFNNCKALENITLPNSVITINDRAFRSCELLEAVVLTEGLETIGEEAFLDCIKLNTITIPNSVKSIENGAFIRCVALPSITIPNNPHFTILNKEVFYGCSTITSVDIPNNVTHIDNRAFDSCANLNNVTIPEGVTRIGIAAFYNNNLTSVTIPSTVTLIDSLAFDHCPLTTVLSLADPAPAAPYYSFPGPGFFTEDDMTLTVPFNAQGYAYNWGIANWKEEDANQYLYWKKIYHKINYGERKTLSNTFEITTANKREVINEGVLVIEQGGELVNEIDEINVGGIIEVKTKSLPTDKWSFIGAPFAGYKLETVVPGANDISISEFDYDKGQWSSRWATILTEVEAGEGLFTWSFASEPTTFTTYGDVYTYGDNYNGFVPVDTFYYDFNVDPLYAINNGDVPVTKTVGANNNGNWMALANPYTFKLDIAKFLANQQDVQGGVSYRFDGTQWETTNQGVIDVTEGFFVNFASNNDPQTATFKKSQRYIPTQAKASAEREYVRLAMLDEEREIEVLFAQNDQANENYDIFDANKLFSPIEIAEPYFVVNNIALVKEEVNTLPYYATMNVRSFGNKEVTFKANYIPEGLAVSIIDGEETIDLSEGVEYTTNIIAGENADRFKVLIKKSLSIEEAEELQVNIYNNNRHINIETIENDLQVEVYNALGQKVLSTKDRNFTLNQVPAGAYLIKAFNNKASKTQKIVVK
ncbi:MAG: leucine-rich repeat domain-containing protein [Bacteroidales bacterium]|nr:leucine-rich repeat domain-containing protein [Bacteroidales bacterium]